MSTTNEESSDESSYPIWFPNRKRRTLSDLLYLGKLQKMKEREMIEFNKKADEEEVGASDKEDEDEDEDEDEEEEEEEEEEDDEEEKDVKLKKREEESNVVEHTIDGRTVEAKRALSKEQQHTSVKSGNLSAGGGIIETKKIFVGGLPPTLTEDGFRSYFEQYGTVTDVVVMYDQITQRPRGFGFISFESEDSVDNVLSKSFHDLNGKLVEVKRALPKYANPGCGRLAGGGYQGYGSSGGNGGAYDARMDASRYVLQPQAGGGRFSYNSVGYGGGGYGYRYGGASDGSYGNPNAPNAGYVSGTSGSLRSPWGAQAPSGFGSVGYGANAGYRNTAPWNASGAGGAAGSGFGSLDYGYGESDGSYAANQGLCGAVGGQAGCTHISNIGTSGWGDQQGSLYFSGDANSGFWRSDTSQAGAYGAVQTTAGGRMGCGCGCGCGGGYGGQYSQAQQWCITDRF